MRSEKDRMGPVTRYWCCARLVTGNAHRTYFMSWTTLLVNLSRPLTRCDTLHSFTRNFSRVSEVFFCVYFMYWRLLFTACYTGLVFACVVSYYYWSNKVMMMMMMMMMMMLISCALLVRWCDCDWLRRMLRITRRDRMRNEIVREMLQQNETIVEKIRQRRLKWFGHVTRMDDCRLALLSGGRSSKRRRTT